ncbi:MAG TPA: Uma2 family endonuclease [Blastocatellia bacterium]|nr:Uma2 family endonuclease [Blastocatellia bacterium]HMX29723.1 Uma2 family endonuclease [Blastocatellia bacterium]HNG31943.1 Uma2 family endonuclease [Blastocatellia bacterium]
MSTKVSPQIKATVEDLYSVPEHGKAELINGKVVRFMATGFLPNRAASRVWRSLDDFEQAQGGGVAVNDNAAFIVDLPHRGSFSPDAAWFTGALPGMKFFDGAPVFAVEVRSEGDYGEAAEKEMAAKRRDYFDTGTLVVWDVDLVGEEVVRVYRADDPEHPTVYRRGEIAEAEPAVPGWRFPVDELFR